LAESKIQSFELPAQTGDFSLWLRQNRQGFVLNEKVKKRKESRLHRAICQTIQPPLGTGNPKHCSSSSDPEALIAFAKGKRIDPIGCPTCGMDAFRG
jgi:hypothetical protein